MNEEESTYLGIGKNIPGAQQSQMFGKSCFKSGGKAFICFFQSAMVFKLQGETHREALSLEGAQLFDPSGKNRPMKEWVQVPFAFHRKWPGLAEKALEYVNDSQ
ncbi:hypothetical protein [Flavobacterium humi]|uniref:TfoX N-terminal domain-containing protein n=1 Tax=Flavobacterium humi TaxID=2562683 RepID=A0A4Z0LCI8_9FLAO|nr:hypothetical protein [Flavobacterium humi]TGD59583.1 hypothetical protein E4635_01215 [Flavobacterium humi]